MSPTPRALCVQGLSLRLWDHGGDGPAALFLHGYLDTGRSFDAVAASLDGKVRALCLDLRGHGESERVGPGGSYHLLDHLKDVAVALTRLEEEGVPVACVVGHSMGGNVALLLAGAWPERVERLFLLDSLGAPPEEPEEQPARLGELLRSLEVERPFSPVRDEDDAIARLVASNPGLSERGARRMVAHVLVEDKEHPGLLRFPFDPRLRGPTPLRWPEAMWRALCARVTAQVRVLRAEHGYVPEGEPAAGRLASLRDATLETLPGVSHHVHVEAPEAVARALRSLLDGEAT